MSDYIGIDIGTSTTKICRRGKGIILREPTAIAFNAETGEVIAAGIKAKKMLGRTPPEKEVVLPMRGGVIANYDDSIELIMSFLNRLGLRGVLRRPRVAVSIPWGVTEVERNAFENVCIEAGARDVSILVSQPMAAALGAGVDILKARGSLICNIGAGDTQSSVISYRGTVHSSMLRIGGDEFDAAIISYIKNTYNVQIGPLSAELLKKTIGSAHRDYDRKTGEVRGRNLLTGQAAVLNITSAEVREAISDALGKITEQIKSVLEGTPPEITADICESGLILCGGCALLPGLSALLEESLGMRVNIVKQPLDCVIRGMNMILESPGELTEVVSIDAAV